MRWVNTQARRACELLGVGPMVNHNKATCALTNKLARICYATLRDHAPFDEAARLSRKAGRQSFAIPA